MASSGDKSNVQPPQNTPQILRAMLKLLQDSKSSVDTKLRELLALLSKMPPWMQWSPRDDSVVGDSFSQLHPGELSGKMHEVDSKENDVAFNLTCELIELNKNVPSITHRNLEEGDERFSSVFVQWLHAVHAPDDDQRHVQDQHGTWLTDEELRRYLREGAELHVPLRLVAEPRHAHAPRT